MERGHGGAGRQFIFVPGFAFGGVRNVDVVGKGWASAEYRSDCMNLLQVSTLARPGGAGC